MRLVPTIICFVAATTAVVPPATTLRPAPPATTIYPPSSTPRESLKRNRIVIDKGSLPSVKRVYGHEKGRPFAGIWDRMQNHIQGLVRFTSEDITSLLILPGRPRLIPLFHVLNIALEAEEATKKNLTAAIANKIRRSLDYARLRYSVTKRKDYLMNCVSGILIEETAAMIEALDVINTKILGKQKISDGWEHTVARFGTKSGVDFDPTVFAGPLAKVEALAGTMDPRIDPSLWTSVESAIKQVRDADWMHPRQKAQTVAALISVYGVGAWEKLALAGISPQPDREIEHEPHKPTDMHTPTPIISEVAQSLHVVTDTITDLLPTMEDPSEISPGGVLGHTWPSPSSDGDDTESDEESSLSVLRHQDDEHDSSAGVINPISFESKAFGDFLEGPLGRSLDFNGVPFDRVIERYFTTDRPNAIWERTSTGHLRPRALGPITPWNGYKQLRARFRICGRLIGIALRFNVVPRLAFSPATLALLQTPQPGDMAKLAVREDPSAAAALDKLLELSPLDRAKSKLPSGIDIPVDLPTSKRKVEQYVHERKIKDIVLSIYDQMSAVNKGVREVVDVPYLIDLLTPQELDAALR